MKRTLFLSALVAGVALALAAGSYSVLAGTGAVTEVAGVVMGVEDPDNDGVSVQAGEDGEGAQDVAKAIADTFEVPVADVVALHDSGIGFGAIFKLYLLAAAGDGAALAILDFEEKGEGGFGFGALFKEMASDLSALSSGEDGIPKNLGLAKKAANGASVAAAGGGEDDGEGPPEHAPAHGLNRN